MLAFLLLVLTAFMPLAPTSRGPLRVVSVSQTLAKMTDNSAYFEALVATKLESMLDGPGGKPYPNISVFAPTNEAVKRLKTGGMAYLFAKGQERKLSSVLSFSMVSGATQQLALSDGQVLHTTHGGMNLHVVQRGGRTWLTGGTAEPLELKVKPIVCDNGSIYVIDEVLLPLARFAEAPVK
ncbi:fasciclin domain-containing protein [Hymenobacter sp. BRD67]|uniref:fasciclin domain-containing protein n=1 Tax=Hymenobacter sp. BRD67 TaxID=2675877 RepID=UPI001565D26C|nr:fasciclin domain-containing protein [Hymenobacter sp. BRD67]QKG52654.1 fasciclin domain-containing protein [Hymenobacter sp. BRD67]